VAKAENVCSLILPPSLIQNGKPKSMAAVENPNFKMKKFACDNEG